MTAQLIIEAREKHINAVIRRASVAQIEEGINWYPIAHDMAFEMANGNLEMGAGVLAAFSPQNSWTDNIRIARLAFVNGFGSGHTPANVVKVNRILAGETPLDVLGGKKVRSFYSNIVNPNGDDVTVDRHAVSVAIGRISTDKDTAVLSRKGAYEGFVSVYRRSAKRFGYFPAAAQAIAWTVIRNEKGLK